MKKNSILRPLFLMAIIIAILFSVSTCAFGIEKVSTKIQIGDYIKKLNTPEIIDSGLKKASIEIIKFNKTFICYIKGYEYNAALVAVNTSNNTEQYEISIPAKYIGKNTTITDLISLKSLNIVGGKVKLYMAPNQSYIFILQYESLKLNIKIVYFAILGLLIITLGLVLLKRYASSKIN